MLEALRGLGVIPERPPRGRIDDKRLTMAKDRFSELQRLILSKLCQAEDNCIHRDEVYSLLEGKTIESDRGVVCRSLRRLKERGLIKCNMRHSPKIWLHKED